jgi:hypothetical protein
MALDALDVLAARVRDLEGKIKRMEEQREYLVTLTPALAAEPEAALQWEIRNACHPRGFLLQDDGRTIELVRGGLYLISLYLSVGDGTTHEIEINGKREGGLSAPRSHHQTLSYSAWVAPKAALRIVNRSTAPSPAGSILSITAAGLLTHLIS